jgi:putative peptide zinc metalloprotease protein
VISRSVLTPWLRRPVVLSLLCALALAALLSGGLVVARAVDGAPVADTETTTDSGATEAAGGNGDTNVAGAVNTKDGKTVYAIRLKVVQTAKDEVDATNAAVAVGSCADCTTVAIAFEGVLVAGEPTDFSPTNLALAYNVNCSNCTTVASAYQQVVQRSTRVRITGAGRREIAAIRQELNGLRKADLSYDEIVARVAAAEDRFAAVLLHECVPVGDVHDAPPAEAQDVSDVPPSSAPDVAASEAPGATDAPSPTVSAETSPAPTPEPTETPAGEPSASTSAEPTATPSG